ncbi:MAG: hypothetical protein K1X74_02080 [Pirellulales bacterium]|nr:hypothetical protein [Pirellulales bacterium]
MAENPFDQLADHEVPPLPLDFDLKVHARVNDALVGTHLVDFGLRAIPLALAELARAAVAMVVFTLAGSYPTERRTPRPEDRNRAKDAPGGGDR